jgi:hypothetical protein
VEAGKGRAATGHKRPENQALFHATNARLKNRLGSLESGGRVPFVCECEDGDCMDVIEVSLDTFDAVHAVVGRFLLRPGHETGSDEDVVSRSAGHVVIQKRAGR